MKFFIAYKVHTKYTVDEFNSRDEMLAAAIKFRFEKKEIIAIWTEIKKEAANG